MAEWVRTISDVGVGLPAGIVDQILQNQDDKRESAAGAKLSIIKQYGTWYNYGVPIAAIVLSAFGVLKGDWATRVITAGSTLAGRKATWHITKRERVVSYTRWTRERQLEAERAAAQAADEKRRRPPVREIVPPPAEILRTRGEL